MAVVKKVPMRCCVSCREMYPKKELIRIVKTPDGEVAVDKTGKLNGRGAYICGKAECFKKLKKSRLLGKIFGCEVPDEVYLKIEEELGWLKG